MFSVLPVGIIPGGTVFKLKRAGGKILGGAHGSLGIVIVPESDAPEILGIIGQRRPRINDVRAAVACSGVGHARAAGARIPNRHAAEILLGINFDTVFVGDIPAIGVVVNRTKGRSWVGDTARIGLAGLSGCVVTIRGCRCRGRRIAATSSEIDHFPASRSYRVVI